MQGVPGQPRLAGKSAQGSNGAVGSDLALRDAFNGFPDQGIRVGAMLLFHLSVRMWVNEAPSVLNILPQMDIYMMDFL